MRMKLFFVAISLFSMIQVPQVATAFECPKRFTTAQAAIDKVVVDMKGEMSKKMAMSDLKSEMALIHSLLDDAKMILAGAKHNHEKPQGAYDHARAIAKAETARGYAEAADIYHFKMMAKMK